MTSLPLPKLKPAHDIYRAADGAWRISSPGDRFDRIELPDNVMAVLARALTTADIEGQVDPGLFAFLDAFAEEGYAHRNPVTAMNGGVCLLGVAPYLKLASELLASAGVAIIEKPEGAEVEVVGQLSLDDAGMLSAERSASHGRIPVHRAFAEGGRWFVGPMTIPGRTATYADYRGRRLAACDVPEELALYWKALPVLPPRYPEPGVAALIAGLLVADVLALLAGETPPTAGYQIEIDPKTLEVTRHPVLPLPAGLWEAA